MSLENMQKASLELSASGDSINLKGSWTVTHLARIDAQFSSLIKSNNNIRCINGSDIQQMDTAGALLVQDNLRALQEHESQVELVGFSERQQGLFELVAQDIEVLHQPLPKPLPKNILYQVGEWGIEKCSQTIAFLSFIGELFLMLMHNLINIRRLQFQSIVNIMDVAGYKALPIIALMTFLIGIVLAYQLGVQLKTYGASIFIVDLTGIAILREFAPLITAVIMAGRTSTSFAAIIGTMKVNEEVDALRTMGISPMERIVVPRIIGLILVMPLLVVWSDIFGVLGSMVMAKSMVGIGFVGFMERFREAVALKQYVLGLIKAPIFACIIAGVGCFRGFQVGSSAESVGDQTTRAAVQSIFLIIIADAFFSVIYSWMGL